MALDFLNGDTPNPEPVSEPVVEPIAEGPARGTDGKFVSAQPDPQPEPAPVAAPEPVAPTPEPQHAPITALLDEREKRQAAERRANELEAKIKAATPAPQAPDAYQDPEGFAAHQQQQFHSTAQNIKLDISEDMARQRHGDELVDKARDWVLQRSAQSPAFGAEVVGNRNPYEFAVQAYQRDQIASQIQPADFEAFKAWQAAQAGQAPNPLTPAAAVPQPPAAPPPVSLADAPSAGGIAHVPTGPGQAFAAVIK